jgi:hypothetical protein
VKDDGEDGDGERRYITDSTDDIDWHRHFLGVDSFYDGVEVKDSLGTVLATATSEADRGTQRVDD